MKQTRPAARGKPRPDPSRRVAFDLLRGVDERDAYANLLMPTLLRSAGLVGRDAAFATELAYGTLRMQGQHDAVLALAVDRALDQIDPPVLTLLRLGTHQLHHMRVPVHAAVGETVELARAVVGEGRASFVNAVLRRIGTKSLSDWLDQAISSHPAREQEIRFSHPRWIIDAFSDSLESPDELSDLLAADNEPAAVVLALRNSARREELLAAGAEPTDHSPFGLRWHGALDIRGLGGPEVGVQDEGSQLVTLALLEVPVERDRRWLDLCAGPGGKAALMSMVAEERDASITVTANEIAPHRAELVRKVVRSNTTIHIGDGRAVSGEFDRVLVDAPCSGIGALRRRPEARWRRTAADVGALRPLQRELLAHGLSVLAPGGVLGYVTCSPHSAETVQLVDTALRGRDDLEVIDPAPYLHGITGARRGRYAQLWPHRHGTDGMFLALIRRSDR